MKNLGIIGILAYPKSQSAKEGTVASLSLLEGNGLRSAYIMWGNHQGKGWLKLKFRSFTVSEFFCEMKKNYVLNNTFKDILLSFIFCLQ